MNHLLPSSSQVCWILLALFGMSASILRAETSGLFTYRMVDGVSVTITDYPEDATGTVEIPAEIEGLPVTGIGVLAFNGCLDLISIAIPDSVTNIHPSAFSRCNSLTAIEVHPFNPNYLSLDGVLFNKDQTTLIRFPGGRSGSYTIPETVTEIVGGQGRLNGVGSYGPIIWGPINTFGAFSHCANLTSVVISNNVTHIGEYSFRGCTSLTSVVIPNSVIRVGHFAFSNCTGLAAVTIGAGVADLGAAAFNGCTGLEDYEVDSLNPHFSSPDGVLFTKDRALLLRYPAGKKGHYQIPEGVIQIGKYESWYQHWNAFADCPHLTSVSIPDSVNEIGSSAFAGCTSLSSISIPTGVTGVGYAVFSGCTALASVSIPDSVTFIEEEAFEGCTSLSALTIPDSVTDIGNLAFSRCRRLTFIAIPDSVNSLGGLTFKDCSGLVSVSLGEGLTSLDSSVFEGCASLKSALFQGNSPDRVDQETFADTAPSFTVYYLSGKTGFTSPVWHGSPAVMLEDPVSPTTLWLVSQGLPHDADLNQDLNSDGVSLLIAFALDLDPRANLSGRLPAPVLANGFLRLTFPAATNGVTYTVETSTDLQRWTTDGVTLTDLDPTQHRTASVQLDSPRRFLRLIVDQD